MVDDKLVFDPEPLGLDVFKIGRIEATCWCPFHDDTTPSATFNIVKGLFHCFGCGVAMNAKQLANELGGEVVKVRGLVPKAYDPKERSNAWRLLLRAKLAWSNPYLKERKVPNNLINKYGILEYPGGIVFPIHNIEGDITGVQVRRYSGRPKYMFYGERQPLWPMDRIWGEPPKAPLVLVEGIFGALRAESAGVEGVYATMSVSSVESLPSILMGRKVVSAFDDDDAGILATAKLIMRGIPALWPMMEADEISADEWIDRMSPMSLSGDVMSFAKRYSKPYRFWKLLHKTNEIWYNNSGYSPIPRSSL